MTDGSMSGAHTHVEPSIIVDGMVERLGVWVHVAGQLVTVTAHNSSAAIDQ